MFRAISLETGQVFAMKEVEISNADDPETKSKIESFEKEVNLMKKLSHPNILRYLGTQVRARALRERVGS